MMKAFAAVIVAASVTTASGQVFLDYGENANVGGQSVYCGQTRNDQPDHRRSRGSRRESCQQIGMYVYCGHNCQQFGMYVYCGDRPGESCEQFGMYVYCGYNCKQIGLYVYCSGGQASPASPASPD